MFVQTGPYMSQISLWWAVTEGWDMSSWVGPYHLGLTVDLPSLYPKSQSPTRTLLLVTVHRRTKNDSNQWGTRDRVMNRDTRLQPVGSTVSTAVIRKAGKSLVFPEIAALLLGWQGLQISVAVFCTVRLNLELYTARFKTVSKQGAIAWLTELSVSPAPHPSSGSCVDKTGWGQASRHPCLPALAHLWPFQLPHTQINLHWFIGEI